MLVLFDICLLCPFIHLCFFTLSSRFDFALVRIITNNWGKKTKSEGGMTSRAAKFGFFFPVAGFTFVAYIQFSSIL